MSQEAEQFIAQILLNQHTIMTQLRALTEQLNGHPSVGQGWMRTSEAALALKSDGVLNARHLRKLQVDKVFSEKNGEIRNVSKGTEKARWEYHVPKCRAALQRHFKGIAKYAEAAKRKRVQQEKR
ncbi:hypothetical protein LEP3755_30820 [Leptolyngbya sp. NIES-3755]|nr:hypothetical protein LEP3755_30820 [Leptolyngbya sp. NIES-3755]